MLSPPETKFMLFNEYPLNENKYLLKFLQIVNLIQQVIDFFFIIVQNKTPFLLKFQTFII